MINATRKEIKNEVETYPFLYFDNLVKGLLNRNWDKENLKSLFNMELKKY